MRAERLSQNSVTATLLKQQSADDAGSAVVPVSSASCFRPDFEIA
jgi:hypothetical protein